MVLTYGMVWVQVVVQELQLLLDSCRIDRLMCRRDSLTIPCDGKVFGLVGVEVIPS